MPDEHETDVFDRLAHDLRGPLTPLQTAAFLLQRGDVEPARQHELMDIIARQTTRLGGMVQEIEDWHSATQGRLRASEELTELGILLGLACEGAPSPSGIKVDLADAIATACIAGDARRLVQMLATLLAFARAKAPDRSIAVSGAIEGADALLSIRVGSDSPVPTRLDEDIFRRPQGAPYDDGLGWRLMIANAIAKAHGGALLAEVASGVESDSMCLRIHLPMQSAG